MNDIRRWAIFLAVFLAGGGVRADIGGSAHDFSSQTWAGGQICIVCHTPHNAQAGAGPLWNHASTTTTFTLYGGSGTFTATISQPDGASRACLSCHDGTVAPDSYGGNVGTAPLLTPPASLGADLSNDHPVSIVFDTALATADGELFNPATALSGVGGGTIQQDMLFGAARDRLECASCHDVHNSFNQAGLLVKSNAASALCLTCHNK
jgi:predicted CXXCH cytochrome family protein